MVDMREHVGIEVDMRGGGDLMENLMVDMSKSDGGDGE